ncbi:MAG: exosome complex RNA-binding protein Csl4 [Ignisphaera sp.]|nr:exosome complex RNA-binding protein Csl4 [Ignisphaera sp.]MCX8168453.1 exosome complex RNA-binding protein Csl4 [Ignisphaera sp.]MDW8085107.1 exosome complex RNA-binding protein Csl4 [Ignisphaera sp.]
MNSIVVPGEALCVEEEFMPFEGVYTLDGVVRANTIGIPIYDVVNRRIYIKPAKNPKRPKSGDIVIGVVDRIRDEMATIRIIGYDVTTTFKHTFTGILHISQVMESRAQNLYDFIKLGDFVKVKILNSYIPYIVSMKDPRLGVILAYCSKCGSQLIKTGDFLKCTKCNNTENRKLSVDYMLVKGK